MFWLVDIRQAYDTEYGLDGKNNKHLSKRSHRYHKLKDMIASLYGVISEDTNDFAMSGNKCCTI